MTNRFEVAGSREVPRTHLRSDAVVDIDTVERPGISKRRQTTPAPLSFAQRQMWVLDQLAPGNTAYGMPAAYRLKGPLDIKALEDSFNEVIKRHEVLRTTYAIINGEPQQTIHQTCNIAVQTITFAPMPLEERERHLQLAASQESRVPFDLSRLPLVRVLVFRIADYEHVLFINVHHIAGDGISFGLMLRELDHHYRERTGFKHTAIPDLKIQYADFAIWQRESVATKSYVQELGFWRQQLHGAPAVLELPADMPRPPVQSFKGSNIFFEIPKTLAKQLSAIGASEGCTAFTTLLAAFQVLLQRYSGARDIVIGTPVSLRTPAEVEPLIGNFLNMIPLRCDLSGNPTFLEVLRRTRRTTVHAFSKVELPFEKIVENVPFRRDPSRNPLFQVMFEVLPPVASRIGGLEVESFYFDTPTSKFDLSLHASEEPYGYACRFEYCADLFKAGTIRRMSESFDQLLSFVVANPSQRISEVPLLIESEKSRLAAWNRTEREYPNDQCLHHLFEATAARNPDRIAVECAGQKVTYSELNRQASQFADYLIASGVKTEEFVGVYLERSPQLIIALLGILKAGAAYVPLDPSFPVERLAYMIDDANISSVVTHSNLLKTLPPGKWKPICLDSDYGIPIAKRVDDPCVKVESSNLAYTLYTSGSSGKPKGVMIEHRSVVNCLSAMQVEPGFDGNDVMVSVTTISFDIAALEIFLPLISGGKLVIASKNETLDGSLLADLVQRSKATMLQATPSTWKMLIDAGWQAPLKFKMLCGGEALPRGLANRLLDRGGQLWNMYGPTETTIWSAVYNVHSSNGPVPIGRPIANTQFYLVDEELQPVPIGVPGELLIGGDGLARGYLNQPELTETRFVRTRFEPSETRVYKTGDLARFHSDGRLEFLGRRDFQVKIRGHRIELEEVEHVLAQHESIKEAVVIVWEDQDGDKRLVAYYIPLAGCKPVSSDLRTHMQDKLPHYMCPSFFVELETFPLTPNAKIDRTAFPRPDLSKVVTDTKPAGPQSQLMTRITAIWQEVLKCPVGTDDNFFELGGHSLLAARLFAQIEKVLGVKLPLSTLLQFPTVRTLADRIEENGDFSFCSSLVPIQVGGDKPALFLVHGAEGNVLLYKNLAHYLGTDQPVFGLEFRVLHGDDSPETTFENIAARYLREIRSVQPTGPYYLGGYCLGGTIAFEIAQQIKRIGESVALLAMFETYNVRSQPPASLALRVAHKVENVYFHVRNLFLSRGSLQFFTDKLKVELSRFMVDCGILLGKLADRFHGHHELALQHISVREMNDRAQAAYQPCPYDGTITLFRPKSHYRGFNDPNCGWQGLAQQGVHVVEMPNYPRGSLTQPFVGVLAHVLRTEIERTLHRNLVVVSGMQEL